MSDDEIKHKPAEFSYVDENSEYYVLQHPNGNRFVMAKAQMNEGEKFVADLLRQLRVFDGVSPCNEASVSFTRPVEKPN